MDHTLRLVLVGWLCPDSSCVEVGAWLEGPESEIRGPTCRRDPCREISLSSCIRKRRSIHGGRVEVPMCP